MAVEKRKPNTVFTDDRTKNKIDKHLMDINDKISESDIANVITDVTPNTPDSDTPAEISAREILDSNLTNDRSKKEGNNDNAVVTPWNIISE